MTLATGFISNIHQVLSGRKEVSMSEEEMKQTLIDRYVDLLEIKATLTETNQKLETKLMILKIKLSSYNIDIESLEKMILHS